MGEQIRKLTESLDETNNKLIRANADIQNLKSDRDKMKARILRIKSKKGKVDLGSKLCKNCSREYDEKDNFNWSCR